MIDFFKQNIEASQHFKLVFLSPEIKKSDSEIQIAELLSGSLGIDATHALTRDENNSEVSAVYSLSSSQPAQFNGLPVLQKDIYLAEIRAKTMATLVDSKKQIMVSVNAKKGAEIVDMLEDYDEDSQMMRLNMALSISAMAADFNNYPCALVIDGESSAGNYPEASTRFSQRITDEIIVVTASENWRESRSNLFQAILGKHYNDSPIYYNKGDLIALAGGIEVYAHTFNHSFRQRGA